MHLKVAYIMLSSSVQPRLDSLTRQDKTMLLKGTVPTTYDATVLRLLQRLAPIRHLEAHFAPGH